MDADVETVPSASPTAFIRDATDEKLGRMEKDGEAGKLIDLYNRLNDTGKQWLLQCAEIASTCDSTRIIKARTRKGE